MTGEGSQAKKPPPPQPVPKIKMTDLMFGSDRNPTQPHRASISKSPFIVRETEAQSDKSICPLSLRQQRPEPGLELMCEGSRHLSLDPWTACPAHSRRLIPASKPPCDTALPTRPALHKRPELCLRSLISSAPQLGHICAIIIIIPIEQLEELGPSEVNNSPRNTWLVSGGTGT